MTGSDGVAVDEMNLACFPAISIRLKGRGTGVHIPPPYPVGALTGRLRTPFLPLLLPARHGPRKHLPEHPCLLYAFPHHISLSSQPFPGLAFIVYWGIVLFGYDT